MKTKHAAPDFSSDPVMSNLFSSFKISKIKLSDNLFHDISESIIGQQLSNKVASIIVDRFINLVGTDYSPHEVIARHDDEFRAIGLSYRKASYIKSLSNEVASGRLMLDSLSQLDDEAVISELVKVKGIGRWTAEMILIFSLGRPDIFSTGDLGLRTAVSKLYDVDREDLKKIEKISQNWRPFRSTASRLLWKSLDN